MLRNFYSGKMISSFVVSIFILETDINKKKMHLTRKGLAVLAPVCLG